MCVDDIKEVRDDDIDSYIERVRVRVGVRNVTRVSIHIAYFILKSSILHHFL